MHLTSQPRFRPRRCGFAGIALLSGGILSGCAAAHQAAHHARSPEGEPSQNGQALHAAPDPKSERLALSPSAYIIPETPGGCPRGMARAGSACVDRYEESLVLSADDTPYPFNRPVRGSDVAARSAPGVFPQGHINQPEAARACARAGKRLCTMAEWLVACKGLGKTIYPYGDEHLPGYCNTRAVHPPSRLFGNNYQNSLNDPRLNLFPGGLARTGAFARCSSDYGVFDMVGNLHEWVSDRIVVDGRLRGIFMGGFYSNDHENGHGCDYRTIAHEPEHHDYSTGFRCCLDPQ